MKNVLRLGAVLILALILQACRQNGLMIDGTFDGAANLQVFVDEVNIGKASVPLSSATADANGNFNLQFEEGLGAGIYNLRIGAKKINFVLDGSEEHLVFNGQLATVDQYNFTVTGSRDTEKWVSVMQGLFRREYKPDDIAALIESEENPFMAVQIAYTALGRNAQFVPMQQKAAERLNQAYPSTPAAAAYNEYVATLAASGARGGGASGPIQVGMEAPDIRLTSPDGTEYALSDLRGQVVLLDFWASWCGPCRRENPNVVDVYHRYKDDGFTVYSVSLDGLDTRGKARYRTPEDLERAMEGQKQRWINAIEQDQLAWDYHVSDLAKWESAAGQAYGVRSIPRTFLIDREGKVAAVNLRGAAAIEQALKTVL